MEFGKKMETEIDDEFRRRLDDIDNVLKTLKIEDQIIANDCPFEKVPKDIMEAIALRLNFNDYISSSLVCKSWRSLLLQSDIFPPQVPWLFLPTKSGSHHIKFYNVLEKKGQIFMLPKGVHGAKIVGCSKGWIVFMTKDTFELSLFNPIFGVQYHLPSLPTTSYLQRVELSSSNVSYCTVAAIFENYKKLAFCKLGDDEIRWEVLPVASGDGECDCTLVDLMFCKQKLHVLIKSETGDGKIENIIVKPLNCSEVVPITLIHDLNYKDNCDIVEVGGIPPAYPFKFFAKHIHVSYLVESTKGQAMLIQKHHCLFCVILNQQVNMIHQYFDKINNYENNGGGGDDDDNSDDEKEGAQENESNEEEEAETVDIVSGLRHILSNLEGFKIYEIEDLARNKRVCKSLGKEEALFLSSNSRLCLESTSSNKLQGNCIHFLSDREKVSDSVHASCLIGFNGIYHLHDSTIHPFIPELGVCWNPKFMWFVPNLN